MKNIAKKKIKKFIHKSFKYIRKSKLYKKVDKFNIFIKIILSLFFFCWFLIGTIFIPPIPLGNISLLIALVILFPIGKVKSKLHFLINKLRINKLYARRMKFKVNFRKFKKRYF